MQSKPRIGDAVIWCGDVFVDPQNPQLGGYEWWMPGPGHEVAGLVVEEGRTAGGCASLLLATGEKGLLWVYALSTRVLA